MRCVFSEYLEVQLGAGSPPGGAEGWRAITRVLRSTTGAFSSIADDLSTTTFPSDCRVCDGPLTDCSLTPVCDACLARVLPQHDLLCEVCGESLGMESLRFAGSQNAQAHICTACRLAPPAYARAVAYAAYEDELRDILHLLKYDRMTRLAAAPLGAWLAKAIATLEPESAPSVLVVAVPLFPSRERQRGFNQSVLLADAAVRHLRKSHPTWTLIASHASLRRTRDTEAQFALQPHARRRNLRGAFAVPKEADLRGKEVLLVDDILTTGATARECARVLLAAGAAKVWVATLARAQAEASIAFQPGDVARWGTQ